MLGFVWMRMEESFEVTVYSPFLSRPVKVHASLNNQFSAIFTRCLCTLAEEEKITPEEKDRRYTRMGQLSVDTRSLFQVVKVNKKKVKLPMKEKLSNLLGYWPANVKDGSIHIDIGGSLDVIVDFEGSEELENECSLPIDSDISVRQYVRLFLLRNASLNKKSARSLDIPNAGQYGIKVGDSSHWKYFDCHCHMNDVRLFLEMYAISKDIVVTIMKKGTLRFGSLPEDFIEFGFDQMDLNASILFKDSGPRLESYYSKQRLAFLVRSSIDGHLPIYPMFQLKYSYSYEGEEAELRNSFDEYYQRGNSLADLPEDEDFQKASKGLCRIAFMMAEYSCFTAICTPSLTGKTQWAFSLQEKVLYFPILNKFTGDKVQSIYKCFEGHVSTLMSCVLADYDLGHVLRDTRDQYLSKSEIEESFESTGSLIVGFFATIFESLSPYVDDPREYIRKFWEMDSFGGKVVQPMSLKEFREKFLGEKAALKEVMVFFDEFPPYKEKSSFPYLAATLRNFLRAMRVPCILMGTETRITNLAGIRKLEGSRGQVRCWCVLITEFCKIPKYFLTEKRFKIAGSDELKSVEDIIELLMQKLVNNRLVSWGDQECNEVCASKLASFFEEQFLSSRPGVAWQMFSCLRYLQAINYSFSSASHLLEILCCHIHDFLKERRPKMSEYGTLCSFLGHRSIGYPESSKIADSVLDFQDFVGKHYYFIKSPHFFLPYLNGFSLRRISEDECTNDRFVKFPFQTRPIGPPVNIEEMYLGEIIGIGLDDEISQRISLFQPNSEGAFQVILPPPRSELFLHFATLNLWIEDKDTDFAYVFCDHSLGQVWREFHKSKPSRTPADGKSAEEIWTSSVINASHRMKFYGLFGDLFVSTIIVSAENRPNMKRDSIKEIVKEQQKVVKISSSILENQLRQCRIPYLCPSGSPFPSELYEVFPGLFGYCQRTMNSNMVDFAFDVYVERNNISYSALGLVEMKDWEARLGETDIVNILRRIPVSEESLIHEGFWGRCKLHFIFCREISAELKAVSLVEDGNGEAPFEGTTDFGYSRVGNPLSTTMKEYLDLKEEDEIKHKQMQTAKARKRRWEKKEEEIKALEMTEGLSAKKIVELEKLKKSVEKHKATCGGKYFDHIADFDLERDLVMTRQSKITIPAGIGLQNLLKDQKINLYFVDDSKMQIEVKPIYEDPSHDLISIIFPIQRGLAHSNVAKPSNLDVIMQKKDEIINEAQVAKRLRTYSA